MSRIERDRRLHRTPAGGGATSLIVLGVAGLASLPIRCQAAGAGQGPRLPGGCGVVFEGTLVEIRSPWFSLCLDVARIPRARWIENRRTGQRISLGEGPEVEFHLDASDGRIGITGWKLFRPAEVDQMPGDEAGAGEGYATTDYDDSKWPGVMNPTSGSVGRTGASWARTRVTIPSSARGKSLRLVAGGIGLFDHRSIRAYLNGSAIGERSDGRRWREPLSAEISPDSEAYGRIRFDGENTIALRLSGFVDRTARLDELDPDRRRELPRFYWPAQFEQYLVIGRLWETPALDVREVRDESTARGGKLVIELAAESPRIAATISYEWDPLEPVLMKSVQVTNAEDREIRLLNVRLGTYRTDLPVSEGEQGFPVYVGGECFLSIAHPAGWAIGQDGEVRLRHHPGVRLAPGERFECMQAVYGVGEAGRARETFLAHVRGRMRRTVRGHDRPYAIFESFGAAPARDVYELSEAFQLEMLDRVGEWQRETGGRFDLFDTHFWEDYHGDRRGLAPRRFPEGFINIRRKLEELGIAPGLWMDITGPAQSIGENPAIAPTITQDPKYGSERLTMCLATEPIRSIDAAAIVHHIQANGVRLFKFDGYWSICYNPRHAHLGGLYSTEAIHGAFLELLRTADRACPDVFLMLYGGYRSPWWLLDADTIYESGVMMEAATPGPRPTPHARDGVTQVLDQSRRFAEDVPPLGWDSLGVWLSDWVWNSQIGKERWQEGFVLDICRGSMLAQPWSDREFLTPPERRKLADFIDLLRRQPRCFGNSRLVLGDPWKEEPYGYCCSDGRRAVLAHPDKIPLDLHAVLRSKLLGGDREKARQSCRKGRQSFELSRQSD